MTVYSETRRALADARTDRGMSNGVEGPKWPEWVKLVLATGAIIVSITLAYATLDKRIALLDQKLDFLVQQVQVKK
jgi:hypothetical protein